MTTDNNANKLLRYIVAPSVHMATLQTRQKQNHSGTETTHGGTNWHLL
jgi:hypothetical protein